MRNFFWREKRPFSYADEFLKASDADKWVPLTIPPEKFNSTAWAAEARERGIIVATHIRSDKTVIVGFAGDEESLVEAVVICEVFNADLKLAYARNKSISQRLKRLFT